MRNFMLVPLFAAVLGGTVMAEVSPRMVEKLNVTVLSTNLAEVHGRGEWGWSALVEADGRCVLFDTGNHADTVLSNAGVLGVDLGCVTDVVLSHHHADHTGGLLTLVDAYRKRGGALFARVHVARGFFLSRPRATGEEGNTMIAARERLADVGIEIRVHDEPTEIIPGIWVTGPIERQHAEKNYPTHLNVATAEGVVADYIPESQGLAVRTGEGFLVVLGCGHAGIVNTLDYVRNSIATAPIAGVMGGFHLFNANDETLDWAGQQLARIAPKNVMGAHCTGVEPLYHLRRTAGMTRQSAVIGSVGATFELGRGFTPGPLAH